MMQSSKKNANKKRLYFDYFTAANTIARKIKKHGLSGYLF